jgi:hypothetical protein
MPYSVDDWSLVQRLIVLRFQVLSEESAALATVWVYAPVRLLSACEPTVPLLLSKSKSLMLAVQPEVTYG